MILSASSWNYFIALCLVWTFSSASSRSGPSTESLYGESCSSTHSFSDFSIHYYTSESRPPNYKGTASSSQGVACRSPDGSMPRGAWTTRARSTLLAALVIFFFVPNDHIFHCLNIPQNSSNLEYKWNIRFIIYCRPECPQLGGAIVKESAFWLITPIYFVTHLKTLYTHIQWIVLSLVPCGHAHFHQPIFFFFCKITKCRKPTFSNSSQVISPICTKLCTQRLWSLVTKSC